uniref:Uncharacterized protein n=1 Tax=Sphaerodactylus townsendi TaxID=933632 RepID=A0ACB8ED50_9SAUR
MGPGQTSIAMCSWMLMVVFSPFRSVMHTALDGMPYQRIAGRTDGAGWAGSPHSDPCDQAKAGRPAQRGKAREFPLRGSHRPAKRKRSVHAVGCFAGTACESGEREREREREKRHS